MRSLLATRIYYEREKKTPIMCSIKAAILDSLHGKLSSNNESADCKNLACFKGKSDRGA